MSDRSFHILLPQRLGICHCISCCRTEIIILLYFKSKYFLYSTQEKACDCLYFLYKHTEIASLSNLKSNPNVNNKEINDMVDHL